MSESQEPGGSQAPQTSQELQPLAVGTAQVIVAGLAVWVVALALTLAIPTLHSGSRHWWPWTCVVGIGLGLFGLSYVRRARGSASRGQTRS